MKDRINKFREYLDYIERHYDNVQKAWRLINMKCPNNEFRFMHDDYVWNMIDSEVKRHDISKLSAEEFTQYRQFFFPTNKEDKDKGLFDKAWEHHKLHNEHHWQTWTERYKNDIYADAFLLMNIVDWVAMGFEFGDTAKNYYEKNKEKIALPEWAISIMYKIFDCIYTNTKITSGNLVSLIDGFPCTFETMDIRTEIENNLRNDGEMVLPEKYYYEIIDTLHGKVAKIKNV